MPVSRSPFKPVSCDAPCEVCGKPDWCRRSDDGGHECHRIDIDNVAGLRKVATTRAGFSVYRDASECPGETTKSRRSTVQRHTHNGTTTKSNTTDSKMTKAKKSFPDEDAIIRAAAASVAHKQGVPVSDVTHSQTWPYRDRNGADVFNVARFDFVKDDQPTKEYRPYHRDGSDWMIGDPDGLLPLYRLDELDTTQRVHLCEGEKCADMLRDLGLNATTWAHGAKSIEKTDWSSLSGCPEVVFQPDNDKAGKEAVDALRKALAALDEPPPLAVIDLKKLMPTLPVKGDIVQVVEYLDSKTSEEIADALNTLADAAGFQSLAGGLQVKTASNIEPKVIDWLWPGRIPIGKLTVIAGDPKTGKSILTADLAARVSTGQRWPDQINTDPDADLSTAPPKPQPGRVVMLSAEDDPEDTIVPRLIAAGADRERVTIVTGCTDPKSDDQRFFSLESDLRHLDNHLSRYPDTQLVIIDPISAYLGDVNENRNAEVRRLLAPLADMAARRRVAVVCISHRPKRTGEKAIYSVMGSLGFTAAARAVWIVTYDKTDKSRRLMLNAGMNLAADPGGLAYTVKPGDTDQEAPVIVWESTPIAMDADDALAAEQQHNQASTAISEASEWLAEKLKTGPLKAADIQADAKDDGISERTLKRAKKLLGVNSNQERDEDGKRIIGHVWSLPEESELREYAE